MVIGKKEVTAKRPGDAGGAGEGGIGCVRSAEHPLLQRISGALMHMHTRAVMPNPGFLDCTDAAG